MKVKISGVGKALPQRVVPNEEIAARLGVDPGWIEVRTGIQERRWAAPDETPATLGAQAARRALSCRGINADDLDHVIVATCTGDHQFPPTSALVHHAIGAGGAGAFDVGAACSGFIYALVTGASMIAGSGAAKVLIVGADVLSRFTDQADPVTAPLFGDAAAAVVLEADDQSPDLSFQLGADGSGAGHVFVPAGGSRMPASAETVAQNLHKIQMAGREVYRSAVRTMSALGADLGASGFDLLIAHQANRRIVDDCAKALDIPPGKVYMNISRYGNTSAASIPLAVCEAWEEGRLSPGDRLLMLAFGAGYTWAGAAMDWTLAPRSTEAGVKTPQVPVGT